MVFYYFTIKTNRKTTVRCTLTDPRSDAIGPILLKPSGGACRGLPGLVNLDVSSSVPPVTCCSTTHST